LNVTVHLLHIGLVEHILNFLGQQSLAKLAFIKQAEFGR